MFHVAIRCTVSRIGITGTGSNQRFTTNSLNSYPRRSGLITRLAILVDSATMMAMTVTNGSILIIQNMVNALATRLSHDSCRTVVGVDEGKLESGHHNRLVHGQRHNPLRVDPNELYNELGRTLGGVDCAR